jgi:hypothetical protein
MRTKYALPAFAVAFISTPVLAAEQNPFQSTILDTGYMVAESATGTAGKRVGRDMAGNEVILPDNFDFGGDNTGAYAGGKIGTGVKDPAVCGTFSSAKCSIEYVKGK